MTLHFQILSWNIPLQIPKLLPKRLPKRLKGVGGIVACCSLLLTACTNHSAYYHTHHPSIADAKNINTLAISEFDGIQRSGTTVSLKLAEGIVDRGHFRLVERQKLDSILDEHTLNQSGMVEPSTAKALKLLGVDGLIFGVVDVFNIDAQTGVEKITREVKTGQYRDVVKTNAAGQTETVKEEVIETVTRDRGYVLKSGNINVTFRLADISTGEILALKSETAHFSKRFWDDEKNAPPSKDQILTDLASKVTQRFLSQIHPRTIRHRVTFETNDLPTTQLAIDYAQTDLWQQAYAKFLLASEQAPTDPSALYNLSLSANIVGQQAIAVSAIQKAIDLQPTKKYIQWLSTLEKQTWD